MTSSLMNSITHKLPFIFITAAIRTESMTFLKAMLFLTLSLSGIYGVVDFT